MKIFNLPDLGEGLAEAEIREWYIKEGDEVKTEQPLVAVETAKALVDVPAPQNGKVTKLYGKPGDIIKTGEPLAAFAEETPVVEEKDVPQQKSPSKPPEKKPSPQQPIEDSGTVVGKLISGEKVLQEAATGVAVAATATSHFKAMPAVRALAKELNIDLAQVPGTGVDGAITIADIKNVLTLTKTEHTAPPPKKPLSEKLHGARRVMAQVMAQSHREVVPVTIMDHAILPHSLSNSDITLRLIRALMAACDSEPSLNAHFEGASLSRELFKEINLGIAVDTQDGLYVPVLKNIAAQSDESLRSQIEKFKEYGKKQSFPADVLKGATFTLSNFGMFGGRYANPIVVPPMVAILAAGKISQEVVPLDNKPVIQRVLPLSLTFDHRAVTGGEATRFLRVMITHFLV